MLESIIEGSKRTNWKDRVPYAYWKGNPNVSQHRINFMKCNVSEKYDWNARLYEQASSLDHLYLCHKLTFLFGMELILRQYLYSGME